MNLLDISSKYLSLDPDKLLKANKVYEWVITQYEDSDQGIDYLKENLSGRELEYALELLEAQSSYMGTPIYFQNGKFSAPRLALYGYESRPVLKTKIREKIGRSNELENKSKELRKTRKEEVELDEADSIAAMQARREKRLQAQRKREGRPTGGGDFGHDYGKPRAQADAEREQRMKAFINKEEYELDEAEIMKHQQERDRIERSKASEADRVKKARSAYGKLPQYSPPTKGKHGEIERRQAQRPPSRLRSGSLPEEYELDEKIDVGADAGATIDDFVHSKSKTFKGDSKKERIRRALGAYYGAKNEAKNEEGKEQGADGKACWKGYKYNGTENGKDKCVKEDQTVDEAWYSGKGQYRTTASGNRVRWDEDDATDDKVSDMLQKRRQQQAAAAGKERLKAKGAVPTKGGKPVFEGVEIDENLELFVRYVLDKEIVESIEEVNELLATIDEEGYQYIVSEAMAVAPAPQQKPQPQANQQQQKPQPQANQQQQKPQPTAPNPQQAQQNSPTPSAAPQPNRPQPNTPAPAGAAQQQQQKPQPKKPGMTTEEAAELQTKKKDGVVINPKADEDMTAGEKPSSKKVSSKLKEHFSLNVNKKSIINQFINIK